MKTIGIKSKNKKGIEVYLNEDGWCYGPIISWPTNPTRATVYKTLQSAQDTINRFQKKITKRINALDKNRIKVKKMPKCNTRTLSLRSISVEKCNLNKSINFFNKAKATTIDVPISTHKNIRTIKLVSAKKKQQAITCSFCGTKLIGIKYAQFSIASYIYGNGPEKKEIYKNKSLMLCPICVERAFQDIKPELDKITDDVRKEYTAEIFIKHL